MPLLLHQKIQFGSLELSLNDHEVSILKLLLAPSSSALTHWKRLWESLPTYDDLEFSCKELMPSAIRRLQSSVPPESWQNVCSRDITRLLGLPRHLWTKSHYILNQYKAISEALKREGIEHVALKGIGELLANTEYSLMRTLRDIDLLIKPSDETRCKVVVAALGWNPPPQRPFDSLSSVVKPHAEALVHTEGVMELDIHVGAISGRFSNSEDFTEEIWKQLVPSSTNPSLYIPAERHRLIIAVANAYVPFNWQNGHFCKYIFDAYSIANLMREEEIQLAIEDGERHLGIGGQMRELLSVVDELKSDTHERSVKNSDSPRRLLTLNMRSSVIKKLQYLEYFQELCRLLVSGKHTFRTIYLLIFWGTNLLFVKTPKALLALRPEPNGRTRSADENRILTWYCS